MSSKKIKRWRGVPLDASCFLYIGDLEDTRTWLFPVTGLFTAEYLKGLIEKNLRYWPELSARIPQPLRQTVRWQLCGAAMSWGVPVPKALQEPQTVRMSEREMQLLIDAHSFSDRMMTALMHFE